VDKWVRLTRRLWRLPADILLREVQDVWTWVRPYFDDRATAAALVRSALDDVCANS
jgi:hypothetical protein